MKTPVLEVRRLESSSARCSRACNTKMLCFSSESVKQDRLNDWPSWESQVESLKKRRNSVWLHRKNHNAHTGQQNVCG